MMLDEAVKVAQKSGGKVKINGDGTISIEFWPMWNIFIYVYSNPFFMRSCVIVIIYLTVDIIH